jgi:membrane-associated phospholipid phosphatase
MHHLSDVAVAIVNGLLAALLAWGWLRRSPSDQDEEVAHHGGARA